MAETYAPKLKRPATRDRLAKKKPLEQQIPIVVDPDVVDVYEEAQQEYERASLLARTLLAADGADESSSVALAAKEASERLVAAESALNAAGEALEDAVVIMTFRSIGARRFDEMIVEHPPTDKQVEEAKEKGEDPPAYDVNTFGPALVHASCIVPDDLTLEDVEGYYAEWNQGDIMLLWMGALSVNQMSRSVPDLPKASGPTLG